MIYVLDTNTFSELMKATPAVIARLRAERKTDVLVPPPVVAEIAFGLSRLRKSKKRTQLEERFDLFRGELSRIGWTDEVSLAFGSTKADLQRRGRSIEDFDIAIAAHALAHGATLVTNSIDHMSRVRGLVLEDWTVPAG